MVVEVYNHYNGNPNSLPLYDEDLSAIDKISDDDEFILKQVFDVFGQYASWYLRNKVRKETPWIEATDNGKHLGDKINRETMEKYFKENYIE